MGKITKELLDSTPDEKLEDLLMSYVIAKLAGVNSVEKIYEVFDQLSPGIRIFYATAALEMEVHNGGFAQYFWNLAGLFVGEAIEGYTKIGAGKHAGIVGSTFETFNREAPIYQKYRKIGTLEAFAEYAKESNLRYELYERFSNAENSENMKVLRTRYMRENWKEFITV